MTPKLKRVLLIDDDEATNFINKWMLKKADCADEVIAMDDASEALSYLKEKERSENHPPELIFLDINMPGMNGWEFLEEYRELPHHKKAKALIMLTTSLNPDDYAKAKTFDEVNDYQNKPLSIEKIREILASNSNLLKAVS